MIKTLISLLLITEFASAQISYSQFQSIVSVFHKVYGPVLQLQKAKLVINSGATDPAKDIWWNLPDRHASYSSYIEASGFRIHYIFMFGGYVQMPGMTADAVAMTMCHELGHGIGGSPFKDNPDETLISVEGQSDYFAAHTCIKKILPHLVPSRPIIAVSPWVTEQCTRNHANENQRLLCLRLFQILEVERMYFRTQPGIEQETNFETPDLSVVQVVERSPYYYPSAQCRIDTFIAGVLEKGQPRCWWAP